MNKKIIAIANQKGGVGKTTTTLNFAKGLADKGNKVLLVDFDHQANLTLGCGIHHFDELENSIGTAIIQYLDEKDYTLPVQSYRENIDIIPSNITLSSANSLMIQAMARETILKQMLEPIKEHYDYILIDCAPSLNVDLINAITVADEVLIVTNAARFSASGTNQLIDSIVKVQRNINHELKIAGMLFNRVDRRTNFAKDVIEHTRKYYNKDVYIFETEIPCSIRVDESQSVGVALKEHDENNKVSQSFERFTEEYLNREEGEKNGEV